MGRLAGVQVGRGVGVTRIPTLLRIGIGNVPEKVGDVLGECCGASRQITHWWAISNTAVLCQQEQFHA